MKVTPQSNLKKYLPAAFVFLILILAGRTYYATKNVEKVPQQDPDLLIQNKIALVNNISNLSDDPSITDEVARENQKRAAEAIETLKQTNPANAKLGPYIGILSKCYVAGNDVHWVNENGAFLEHVSIDTPISGHAAVARKLIYRMGGGMVVVIYENGYEAYGMDGKLIETIPE